MTDKEKIRNIIELFIAWNGDTDVIDIANIDSAVDFISDSLSENLKVNKSLTWEDIANINDIVSEMLKECGENILYDTQEDFCKEVLKRFKAQKG